MSGRFDSPSDGVIEPPSWGGCLALLADLAMWLTFAAALARIFFGHLVAAIFLSLFFNDSGTVSFTDAFDAIVLGWDPSLLPIYLLIAGALILRHALKWRLAAMLCWVPLALLLAAPQGTLWRLTGGQYGSPPVVMASASVEGADPYAPASQLAASPASLAPGLDGAGQTSASH